MAGKHNAKTTDAPVLTPAPEQYTPDASDSSAPSGDGPQQYVEG